jgi:hypothetical protein
MNRTLVATAAAALMTGAALTVAAGPAQAATSCSGSWVDSAPIKDQTGSAVWGTLSVYYNSSTGRNCAKATNTTGAVRNEFVWISRCKKGTGAHWYDCTISDNFVQGKNYDRGNYSSYAGPVNTLGSADGVCIEAYAEIAVGSKIGSADIGGHCS